MNFRFSQGPKIIAEDHGTQHIDDKLEEIGITLPLVVTDRELSAAGVVDPIVEAIKQCGYEYALFDQVEPNPTTALVETGREIAISNGIDGIIAVGGGSSVDTAKAISLLVPNGGDWTAYEGATEVEHPSLPLIAVPTTVGTGSEVTSASVITDTDRNVKMTTKSEELYPEIALLDPSLLTSLPPAVTAATGMDSLTQAIEAYVSPSASPITDALALDATKMITESLKPAVLKSDRGALASMQVATTMEGIAFDNAGLGLVHGLSEPVSGKFHTSHGLTNAVLLPHVLEFNMVACPRKYATLAEAMGVQTASRSRPEAISKMIDRIEKISDDIGIPPGVSELGADETAIPELVEEAYDHVNSKNNPREYSKEDLKQIYHQAF